MVDISFLNGILQPLSDFVNGIFIGFLGISQDQLIGIMALLNILLIWTKGRMILDFLKTYWNVLGVFLVLLIIAVYMKWI